MGVSSSAHPVPASSGLGGRKPLTSALPPLACLCLPSTNLPPSGCTTAPGSRVGPPKSNPARNVPAGHPAPWPLLALLGLAKSACPLGLPPPKPAKCLKMPMIASVTLGVVGDALLAHPMVTHPGCGPVRRLVRGRHRRRGLPPRPGHPCPPFQITNSPSNGAGANHVPYERHQ